MSDTPKTLMLHPIAAAYWREEIRLNSPALERLQRICAERDADYAATIAALIVSGMTALQDGSNTDGLCAR